MAGPAGARARRRPTAARTLLALVAAILSGCTAGDPVPDVMGSPSAIQSVDATAATTSISNDDDLCDAVPWSEPGDIHAPGSLTGALQSRANPSLAVVSIDGETLHIAEVLVDHSDGRLHAGDALPVYALAPDGRGNSWWRLAGALGEPVPAILVVPEAADAGPMLLATLTADFRIDQPCVYEAERQQAAEVLELDHRELIEELLRRGDSGESMLDEDPPARS